MAKEYTEAELEAMPLAELEALGQQEPSRDERGRFVAAETAPVKAEPEPAAEPDEIVYRRVIDLQDGSGTQVFEGANLEELVDKLATAQENATRKIRQQDQAARAAAVEAKKPTSDEEWLLGQELMANPTGAFAKIFESQVGMPITAFKTKLERLTAFEQSKAEEDNAKAFMASHPDFHSTPANGVRIERYLRTYQLEGSVENIEKAYQDLSESGLLEVKPAEQDVDPDGTTAAPARIAQPAAKTTVQRRVASGLSSRRSVPVAARASEPTEDELNAMSYEELERRARAIERAAQQ